MRSCWNTLERAGSPGCCQIAKMSICEVTVGFEMLGRIGSSTTLFENDRNFELLADVVTEHEQKFLTWNWLCICKKPRMNSSTERPLCGDTTHLKLD